jgi:hypothetical protein
MPRARVARRCAAGSKDGRMSTSTAPSTAPATRATIAVPGGRAVLLAEHVMVGDDELGEIVVQSLERSDGRRYVRLGYRRSGRMIRGPVSMREEQWSSLPKRPPRPPR